MENWTETTLRKGTKKPKICRDMFIADSRGSFTFCEVKNGQMVKQDNIERTEAEKIIEANKLVGVSDRTFNNCKTYRTKNSNNLIENLLSQVQ